MRLGRELYRAGTYECNFTRARCAGVRERSMMHSLRNAVVYSPVSLLLYSVLEYDLSTYGSPKTIWEYGTEISSTPGAFGGIILHSSIVTLDIPVKRIRRAADRSPSRYPSMNLTPEAFLSLYRGSTWGSIITSIASLTLDFYVFMNSQ